MKRKKNDKEPPPTDSIRDFEMAVGKTDKGTYILHLFVAGMTPNSKTAIENIKKICEEHLEGRYELKIIDIYQQPAFAKEAQIFAAPTLVKELHLPLRKFIGDMSHTERILVGLDVKQKS